MADFNADPNPFPEMGLSLKELVCGCIGRFAMLPTQSEPCLSEHARGASEMLDEALDDTQGQLEL